MNPYERHLSEHRRLTILRLLESAPGNSANESLLHDAVLSMGITTTRDQLRGELAWLGEQGLVEIDDIGGLTIARIRQRGIEVAKGLTTHPGVKKPSPAD